MQRNAVIGRFAPSPTGRMHVGNIFTYLIGYLWVKQHGGSVVLRIDDLDPDRSKQCYTARVIKDLDWFGFEWIGDILYQSERGHAYDEALSKLQQENDIYPCFCSRADLRSTQAPHEGEEHHYLGTCAALSHTEALSRMKQQPYALRIKVPSTNYEINDIFQGRYSQNLHNECGDFIVRRKDGVAAYQFATVVDDAYQNVTTIIRGVDILPSTPRQEFLQEKLCLEPIKTYGHVPLFVGLDGIKLSKRNRDASLEQLISQGLSAGEILGWISYLAGIIPEMSSMSLDDLIHYADLAVLQDKKVIIWRPPVL